MSNMNIFSASSSTAGVPNPLSGQQRSRSTGDLSKNLQSVKNKTEQKSEARSRISSISRLPKGQPSIEASKSIKVPLRPGGGAQINQMGVDTFDSGNSASTSLKINGPADLMCQASEISGSGSPVILGNTSPEWLKTNVIDYVDSLKGEFNYWFRSEFPERVIKVQKYAEDIVFFNNKLEDINNEVCCYFDFYNRNRLDFLDYASNFFAQKLSEAENIYVEGIKTLSADWKISPETNWSEKDTLRLAVIEKFFSVNLGYLLSDADNKKYVPVIFSGEKLIQDICHRSARISSDEEGEAKVRRSSSISEKTDLPFGRLAKEIHDNSPSDEDIANAIKFLKKEIVDEIDFEKSYGDIDGKLVALVLDSDLVSQGLGKVIDKSEGDGKKYFYDNMDEFIDNLYPQMNTEMDLKQRKDEPLSAHFKKLFIQMAKYKAVVEYSRRVEHPRNL